jgi:putative DNA primase/helicase
MSSEIDTELADKNAAVAFAKASNKSRKRKPKPKASPAPDAQPATNAPEKADPAMQPGFFMDESGLHYIGTKHTEKGTVFLPAQWCCAPFKVLYRARGADGLGWRSILQISNRDHVLREITVLDADIGGQEGGWHKALSDAGLKIHPAHRGKLGQYLILEVDNAPRATIVEKTGWHENSYVLPHRTIGAAPEPILFQGQDRTAAFSESGTLEAWRDQVGRHCAGNSRLILAVTAGLAAPLLPFSEVNESGGWHLYGPSSLGKTTALRVASSLHGKPGEYMSSWRATGNAIEGTAARSNHALLLLDEISQAGDTVGNTAMMLANGTGKTRMRDNATLRERMAWQLLWLSTGEHAMPHYLEASGLKADAGMEVRQLDIEADAGAGLGLFDKLPPDFTDARAFAEHLRAACDAQHGVAGVAWLEYVASLLDELRRDLPGEVTTMAQSMTVPGAESQVLRAMRRFGLLAVAGELATQAGITGWKPGDATAGIRACVRTWLAGRGGSANLEDRHVLERFRNFLGRGWQSRFIEWSRAEDERAPAKLDAVGFRKPADTPEKRVCETGEHVATPMIFYVTGEGWAEIFRGMDPQRAAHVLLAKGVLVPGKWTRDGVTSMRPYCREYLPGMGRRQVYRTVANPFALLGDSVDGGGNAA